MAEPDRSGGTQPVAIIGMACRFPGGAENPDRLWELFASGRDAIGPIPPARFPLPPAPTAPGADGLPLMATTRGGFLSSDIRAFDAGFFDIPPAEATTMDPQIRLLLELGYETLEDAGQDLGRLAGGDHGVYVGICFSEYRERLLAAATAPPAAGPATGPDAGGRPLDAFLICATNACSASGRLSYQFGFEGPSLSIDAACSSSLLTVHLACRDLAAGTVDLALAGGINLMLSADTFVAFSRLGVLAPDGRCKAFCADADGYGRAEGAGLVCLKRLADAQRDGDRILAVIEGSATTNDGASRGYTAPRAEAQVKAMRRALAAADLTPDALDLIEAHGTGTRLGDRVEAAALAEVFANRTPTLPPVRVGAAKSAIGHGEGAAGIAALIKTVLALRAERMPALAALRRLSPAITWPKTLAPLVAAADWPRRPDRRRRAGINAFGMSGVNVHLIVAEPPDPPPRRPAPPPLADSGADRPAVLVLPLSARTPEALQTLGRHWLARLEEPETEPNPDPAAPDPGPSPITTGDGENAGTTGADDPQAALAHLLATQAHRRTAHRLRLTAVGRNRDDLAADLARRLVRAEREPPRDARKAPPPGLLCAGLPPAGILADDAAARIFARLRADLPAFRTAWDDTCAGVADALSSHSETTTRAEATGRAEATARASLIALVEALGADPLTPTASHAATPAADHARGMACRLLWTHAGQRGLIAQTRAWGVAPVAVAGAGLGRLTAAVATGEMASAEASAWLARLMAACLTPDAASLPALWAAVWAALGHDPENPEPGDPLPDQPETAGQPTGVGSAGAPTDPPGLAVLAALLAPPPSLLTAAAIRLARAGARLVLQVGGRPVAPHLTVTLPSPPRPDRTAGDDEDHSLPWLALSLVGGPWERDPLLALVAGRTGLHDQGVDLAPGVFHANPGPDWPDPPRTPWHRSLYWVEAPDPSLATDPAEPSPPAAAPLVPVSSAVGATSPAPSGPVAPAAPALGLSQDSRPPACCATALVDQPGDAAAWLARLRAALGDLLGRRPEDLDADASFSALGLDSLMAVTLADRLSALLGPNGRLSPTVFWTQSTPRRLARHLARTAPPAAATAAVTQAPDPDSPPTTDLLALERDLDALLERLDG